ncbi:MAG: type VII secretion protein EccB [Nocardioides sp.]
MATKKDLVEAYSFSRRRLVTAFVSGAPGGREVEPSRPGRTIVGGVALAVLLVAGAAIAGVFAPRTPEDWDQPGLIVSKETGASYVILPPAEGEDEDDDVELRPVANTTSAKLILGDDSTPTMIAQDTIDGQRIGDDIGIFGAPASVPTSSLLINSGWTACTGDGLGVRVSVAAQPEVVSAPSRGITVENDGDYFVVIQSDSAANGARVFPVTPQVEGKDFQTDTLLLNLDLPVTDNAIEVPRDWINLFPVGAALDDESFPIDFEAAPDWSLPEEASGARVGDLLQTVDGDYFLVAGDGPVELTEFAAQVYRNILMPQDGEVVEPIEVPNALGVEFGDDDFLLDTGWPSEVPEAMAEEPCAQLLAAGGEAPMAALVGQPDAAEVSELSAKERDQVVDAGRGAYVLSGGWSGEETGATPYLIDSKARANPLVGSETAGLLGYAEVDAPVVPDTWVELFRCGVDLSRQAALRPPQNAKDATTCE